MNILFVASECVPFIKTGGLADVIGAVPKSLAALGVRVRVMLPGYRALGPQIAAGRVVAEEKDLFGGPARVIAVEAAGLDLLIVDAPHHFDRDGSPYLDPTGQDWSDNATRFAALSRIAARVAIDGVDGWKPDLVSAHDWQAGLVPAYLAAAPSAPPVVMTIHNIAFQGLFDATMVETLGLDSELFGPDGIEYYGQLGFLKAGLALSDAITTVSPTYARELTTAEFGMGLDGLLRARVADLSGILNGIDLTAWDPGKDTSLPSRFSATDPDAKAPNRAALAERFGLSRAGDGPLFCVVSRLTQQKGLDLLLNCVDDIVARGGTLAVLGTGERALEDGFIGAARRHGGAVGTVIGYDEPLAHLMQGGADAILIPSRFEPCGLTQLYGLRYGTIPIVARTGGLADTVIDANPAALSAGCATGVQFSPVTQTALAEAIARAFDLYHDPLVWGQMIQNAMNHPVGWDLSARAYRDVFARLVGRAG